MEDEDGCVGLRQPATEKINRHAHREAGEFGVVAQALVAEESMGSVELMPGERRAGGRERGVDLGAAFAGDVRVLASPDHHEFAFDVGDAGERVIGFAQTETALVDVGRVETRGGGDIGEHGGAEGEVSAEADADGTDAAGSGVMGF